MKAHAQAHSVLIRTFHDLAIGLSLVIALLAVTVGVRAQTGSEPFPPVGQLTETGHWLVGFPVLGIALADMRNSSPPAPYDVVAALDDAMVVQHCDRYEDRCIWRIHSILSVSDVPGFQSIRDFVLADVTGNGRTDIVVLAHGEVSGQPVNQVIVWANTGLTVFRPRSSFRRTHRNFADSQINPGDLFEQVARLRGNVDGSARNFIGLFSPGGQYLVADVGTGSIEFNRGGGQMQSFRDPWFYDKTEEIFLGRNCARFQINQSGFFIPNRVTCEDQLSDLGLAPLSEGFTAFGGNHFALTNGMLAMRNAGQYEAAQLPAGSPFYGTRLTPPRNLPSSPLRTVTGLLVSRDQDSHFLAYHRVLNPPGPLLADLDPVQQLPGTSNLPGGKDSGTAAGLPSDYSFLLTSQPPNGFKEWTWFDIPEGQVPLPQRILWASVDEPPRLGLSLPGRLAVGISLDRATPVPLPVFFEFSSPGGGDPFVHEAIVPAGRSNFSFMVETPDLSTGRWRVRITDVIAEFSIEWPSSTAFIDVAARPPPACQLSLAERCFLFACHVSGYSNCFEGSCAESQASTSAGLIQSLARSINDITVIRRLRDEVMAQSSGGQQMIGVYESMQLNVLLAIFSEPSLDQDLRRIRGEWWPLIENLVDGDGSELMSSFGLELLNDLLHKLWYFGDPELRSVIDRERDRLDLWDLSVLIDQPISELVRRWEEAPAFRDRFESEPSS